ncbi:hypothetical protein QFC22_006537 [Naganishia vaughanmartiniae]|uniref:Uncharacterized protein n=1 Tax=Naganishia vaughanmartiniae TaxID=1424756 RepID=A0ACC2WJI0_9TREE|nr:hypothetical protein QFC22_006537 [Naganishia vaughanmartiniae]
MDDYSTNSESDYANSWITWFLSTKGNEYFVEIDDDYLMDRFNLTGLNGELVKDYSKALDMILDNLEGEESMDDEERESLDTSARFLYGLIHARFIVTSRGLAKMHDGRRRGKVERGRVDAPGCEIVRLVKPAERQPGAKAFGERTNVQADARNGRPTSSYPNTTYNVRDFEPLLFDTAAEQSITDAWLTTQRLDISIGSSAKDDGGRALMPRLSTSILGDVSAMASPNVSVYLSHKATVGLPRVYIAVQCGEVTDEGRCMTHCFSYKHGPTLMLCLSEDGRVWMAALARHVSRWLRDRHHDTITHTTLSLSQLEKYRRADFGRCPRVYCYAQSLLPVGLSDTPYTKAVKLYCPRCEDVYSPKSNRHGSIDGAYFGTTFPHMLFMVYPQMIPGKAPPPQITGQVGGASSGNMHGQGQGQASPGSLNSLPTTANDVREMQPPTPTTGNTSNTQPVSTSAAQAAASAPAAQIIGGTLSTATAAMKAEMYDPKLFGFRVNEMAKLKRWREVQRDL